MHTFFMADAHLGHANIIPIAGRPWLRDGDLTEPFDRSRVDEAPKWVSPEIPMHRAIEMSGTIINNINKDCDDNDKLIHVGDWCFTKSERGVACPKITAQEWEEEVRPDVIHVMGNHDKHNGVKSAIHSLVCRLGQFNVIVQHRPPWDVEEHLPPLPTVGISAYVCGHVHTAFDVAYHNGLPVINVGVEVNNYRPVRQDFLINKIHQAKRDRKK